MGTFIGPLVAGILVGTCTGSVAASVLVAATFGGAAAAVTGVRFERDADARGGLAGGRSALSAEPRPPGPAPLSARNARLGDFVAQIFVRGMLITLIVVASIELLAMGDSGVGLLNAVIGLGGFVGAIGALGLDGRSTADDACSGRAGGLGAAAHLHRRFGRPVLLALAALFVTGVSNACSTSPGSRSCSEAFETRIA